MSVRIGCLATTVGLLSFALPARGQDRVDFGAGERRVYVGVYLSDVSGFDLNQGRFKADLQVWCKWLGPDTPPPIRLANGEIERREEVAREADGDWRSVRWRVQGTFRGTFPLNRFPFDQQHLRVEVDLPREAGVLVPDLAGSGMASRFSITGWLYEPFFKAKTERTVYVSDWGSVHREGEPTEMNTVSFQLSWHRPVLEYLVKFVMPLACIIVMAILGFFISAGAIEVRGSICVTALLSCIAFQFAQSDALPDVSYLVAADKLFLGSYVIILLTMVETVVAFNLVNIAPARSRRLDRWAAVLVPVVSVIGLLWLAVGDLVAERAPEAPVVVQPKPVKSSRRELVVSAAGLRNLNSLGVGPHLLRRGLAQKVDGQYVPHLVEAMPELTNELVRFPPEGGMIVRWQLRPNLKWSDGSPIRAEDVAFSAAIYPNEERLNVNVLDERTVEIAYAQRKSAYLRPFRILPEKHVASVLQEEGTDGLEAFLQTHAPPGDGPYRLEEFEKDQHLTVRRNPHFAGPQPPIERIRLVVDPRPVADKIMAGDAHLADLIGPGSFLRLQEWPGATTHIDELDRLYFLQPDLSVAPYDNPLVRRALLHAMDRRRVGAHYFGENVTVAHSYRLPSAVDYDETVTRYEYDPARARQLLAESGLPRPVRIRLLASRQPAGAPLRLLIDEIAAEWRAVGFEVFVDWTEASTLKLWLDGTHGGLLFFSRRGPNPARFWNVAYEDGRFRTEQPNRLFSKEMVAIFARLESSLFEERRIALSRQIQQSWAEARPVLPLFYGVDPSAHTADFVGWDPHRGSSLWWNSERWYFADTESATDSSGEDLPDPP